MDYYAILSLACLAATIALGFFMKINIGIIGFAVALILGRICGILDSDILKLFGSTLFLRLLGVLLIFSLAQVNGTLEKLARAAVYAMRKIPKLIPLLVFLLAAILGGIAGTIPVFALMATVACSLAFQLKVHPMKLVPFAIFGSMAGSITPISMNGILVATLSAENGIPYDNWRFFFANFISDFIPCLFFYFFAGWHKYKLQADESLQKAARPDKNQWVTLSGILVMIVMTIFFNVDIGLASLCIACVLLLFKVADQKATISGVPWATLLMITGMGVLISMVSQLHGIDLLTNFLSRFLTPTLAPIVYTLLAGLMSVVSSAQGVVMPTLFPTIQGIVTNFPAVSPRLMALVTVLGAYCTSISPFSTGGALAMGAYATVASPTAEEHDKMFLYLIYAAFLGLLSMSILAGSGLLNIILG